MSASEQQTGWAFPGAARKAHYFPGVSTSLCGRWLYVLGVGEGEAESGRRSSDECAACVKRLPEVLS